MKWYCKNCEEEVEPSKDFNWVAFILLLVFTLGIGAIIYILFYAFKNEVCPQCGDTNWGAKPGK